MKKHFVILMFYTIFSNMLIGQDIPPYSGSSPSFYSGNRSSLEERIDARNRNRNSSWQEKVTPNPVNNPGSEKRKAKREKRRETRLIQKVSDNAYRIKNDKNIILTDFLQPFPVIQENVEIKGRIKDSQTGLPVCNAEIICNETNTLVLTNDEGDFCFTFSKNPTILRIRKLGYKDESVVVNSVQTNLLCSLTPVEMVHDSRQKTRLRYASLLKVATGKLKTEGVTQAKTVAVFCRITTYADSILNSLYEGYGKMKSNNNSIREYQSDVARYAPAIERTIGLPGNRLSYDLDSYSKQPPLNYIERFVKNHGSFQQDGNEIVIAGFKAGGTETRFYIRTADTSIVFIKKIVSSPKKSKLKGGEPSYLSNRKSVTEISLAPSIENRKKLQINFISEKESVELVSKEKPIRRFVKNSVFRIIPDSLDVIDAVRDYQFKESMTRTKQNINIKSEYNFPKTGSLFENETQKLLLKPYSRSFWIRHSLLLPCLNEQKEIQKWENNGRFFADYGTTSGTTSVKNLESLILEMNRTIVPAENVYIETDRDEYFAGDTIWFSAFILDNKAIDSTSISKILYVDLINPENKVENHLKLYIQNGRAKGDFFIKKEIQNGVFRIRGYTQWMRNFQKEYFFEKEIPVYQLGIKDMITLNPFVQKGSEGDSVNLYITVRNLLETKTSEKYLDLNIRLNDTISIRERISIEGNYHEAFNFYVPFSWKCSFADIKLTLSDSSLLSEKRISVPLQSEIDIQFFPESGKMVTGINTIIAYKAMDKKGNPVEFEANITDEKQNIITRIKGDKDGIGKFRLIPEFGKTYKAELISIDSKYVYYLPITEPSGYVMSYNPISSLLSINSTLDQGYNKHYLFASVHGVVYSAIELNIDRELIKISLPFTKYPKGIIQILLTDSLFRPLAERLVFNQKSDKNLQIRTIPDKKTYSKREKVNLLIEVSDEKGKPVELSFSLAIIDASKTDSMKKFPDIESYLYLTSELKGKIDYNIFNTTDTTVEGRLKTDLVMMTQGWRNYLWNSIRFSNTLKERFLNENGFFVTGNIHDYNNKRVAADYKLHSFENQTGFNKIIDVNDKGQFRIDFPFFYGMNEFFIQNRNTKGKIDDIRFTLDTIPLPEVNYRTSELPFLPHKKSLLNIQETEKSGIDSLKRLKPIDLPEVTVTAKRSRRNLVPNKEIDLNKTDPTGKKYRNLMHMIMEEFGEKITGPLVIIINGNPYYRYGNSAGEILKNSKLFEWAMSRPVNEISNVKFYEAGSDMSLSFEPLIVPYERIIFRPVVSLSAYADSYRGTPKGAVILPFQGFYQAKEFYQPNYEIDKSEKMDDRATIYWNPEIKTDSTGKARVSFYNSDMKGKANIKVTAVSFQSKSVASSVSYYYCK